tara:strand:+ start:49 stop:1002 length:954 start_codon:yes stop_codon:yes gene_type:complete
MKWDKLGQIFEFDKSPFKKRFVSHAQSPQALVFDDFVRIYFSTRKKEDNELFISHVQFIDMSKDFKKIINHSENEVISLGNLGCFDEHGIFPINPVKIKDKIYAYTSGWTRRDSVAIDSGIGLTVSSDNGNTFKRIGEGPVLSASLHEPFLILDGFVRKFNDVFYMFYIFGKKWSKTTKQHKSERVYKIGYATSMDGINWVKANKSIIEDKIDENECQALPSVIKIRERYHMYFCYRSMLGFREDKKKAYSLGYAYSDDLINWTRDDNNSGIKQEVNSWDSNMMCYPNVFKLNNEVFLLYNGNEFGKYGFGLARLDI